MKTEPKIEEKVEEKEEELEEKKKQEEKAAAVEFKKGKKIAAVEAKKEEKALIASGSIIDRAKAEGHTRGLIAEHRDIYFRRFQGSVVTPRIPARPDWRIRTGFRDARLKTGTPYQIFFFFF